jgi:crotonobetainyl-CoA:carnitine CoA-transferase CaiB-like acyl-CoA transferase
VTALSDLRVLELGEGVSAPFCARLFADFGAAVTKLEGPEGDPTRRWDSAAGADHGALFAWLNGGKTSVRLAGTAGADSARVATLAAGADVLITNLSPAARARHGVDLAALRAQHPHLVTVGLSSAGDDQPRGGALLASALGGVSVILGEPGRPPLHFPFEIPALQAAMHGAAAALAALFARRRSGRGQHVDVAEADVLAYYAGGMALFIEGGGGAWRRRGFDRHGAIYPSGFYPCADGLVFLATQSRAQWTGFLRLMGDPAWSHADPMLRDGVAIGWKRAEEVDLHFIPWLTQHTRRELVAMARDAGLVLGPIHEIGEVLEDAHLAARGFWVDRDVAGRRVRFPGMGYSCSATPARLGSAPRLGDETGRGAAPRPQATAPSRSLDATTSQSDVRPLAGYRAVELGFNWAGPMVGQMLADMGMEVIKIETQGRLDFMRHWPHARRFFHNANRGKRSVAIDVKQPGGAALARRLAAHADLVIDNFAAGVMPRLGLDYTALVPDNPDVVTLSMAMAGQTGPLAHLRGFATMATGFAGLETAIGYPDSGATGLPLLGLGDVNAAIQGVFAALAALWHRERTGEGQAIDLSQIEAAVALMGEPLCALQSATPVPVPAGNRHPRCAPHGTYPVAGDDRWIAVAVATDEEWAALVHTMGMPAWACDEALATAAGRRAHADHVDRHLAAWTAARERDALLAQLGQANVPAAPVLELHELLQLPAFSARRLLGAAPSFDGGTAPVFLTPWHLDATPVSVQRGSPVLGEDTTEVLGRVVGLSASELAALSAAAVLR